MSRPGCGRHHGVTGLLVLAGAEGAVSSHDGEATVCSVLWSNMQQGAASYLCMAHAAAHAASTLPLNDPLPRAPQAYMHKRQFSRSSGKGAALREAGHSASDDEVWTRGGAR